MYCAVPVPKSCSVLRTRAEVTRRFPTYMHTFSEPPVIRPLVLIAAIWQTTAGFLLCERAENKENFAQLKGAYRISDMLLLDYLGKYYSQSLEKASAMNWTFVPTITCTEVLPGLITPATPADLITLSFTAVISFTSSRSLVTQLSMLVMFSFPPPILKYPTQYHRASHTHGERFRPPLLHAFHKPWIKSRLVMSSA